MKTSLSLSVLIIISVYLPENLQNAAACEENFDRIAQCFKDKRRTIRAGIRLSQKEQFREFVVVPRLRKLVHRGDPCLQS